MIENQAYKILTDTPVRCKENHAEYSKALRIAICALDKQIAKKPIEDGYYDKPCVCPFCGEPLDYVGCEKHCKVCGQALLWDGDVE
jgi:hypothetical protein